MIKIQSSSGKTFEIEASKEAEQTLLLNGKSFQLDSFRTGDSWHILHNRRSYNVELVEWNKEEKQFELMINGRSYSYTAKDRLDLLLEKLGMEDLAAAGANDLKAPMPGMVLSILVKPGDAVEKGDPLVVLEAMKMENVLKATGSAVVESIQVEQGKAVEKNQPLISFKS